MASQGRSTWRVIEHAAFVAVLGSAATLAASYAASEAIAGSFLLGVSIALLVGGILMMSAAIYVRGVEGEGRAPAPTAAPGHSLLAHLLTRALFTASLERYSDHRLDGVLTVRNGSARATNLVGLDVLAPVGARVAVDDAEPGGGAPTTVRFVGDHADLDAAIPPDEKRAIRFHVLLDDAGLRARRVRLRVAFSEAGAPERVVQRAVSAAIPR